MTKIIQILLVISFINTSIVTAQTAQEVLKSAYQVLEGHTSISYDLSFASKKFWSEDTTEKFIAHCNILKQKEGKGYFWHYYEGNTKRLANGDWVEYSRIEQIQELQPLIQSFENQNVLVEKATLRPSMNQGSYLHHYFLNPKQLLDYKNAELTSITWSRKDYHHIKVTLEEDKLKQNQIIQLWIDKSTFHIHRIFNNFEYKSMEGIHHDEWNIFNVGLDTLTEATIIERQDKVALLRMMHNYKRIKNYDYSNVPDGMNWRYYSNNNPLLKKGTMIPTFEGWHLVENRTVNSAEFLGMPTILVFWSPFSLGTPRTDSTLAFLSDLQQQLTGEILVMGLIRKDDNTSTEYIYDLVQYQDIYFQNLTVDNNVTDLMGAISFPEIYVLDENGMVLQTFIGYHESYKSNILKLIQP
jgi:hypothetical protein